MAFSPDGTRILTGSRDKTAKVWDAQKGTEILSLKGHAGPVMSVAFSPDGRRILTGSSDQTAKLWDAQKGIVIRTLKEHSAAVTCVAYSPDGNQILTGSNDYTARLWAAEVGTEVFSLKGHTDLVTSLAFSLDARRVFAWDAKGKVLAWSTENGTPAKTNEPPLKPAAGSARSLEGKLLATSKGNLVIVTDLGKPPQDESWPLPDDNDRLAYHSEQAALAEIQGQAFAANFHLGHMLRVAPFDATVHVRLTHVHAAAGQSDKAALHLTQALLLNPKVSLWPNDHHASLRGNAAASAGDWPRAAGHFAVAAYQSATDTNRSALMLALLAANDVPASRKVAVKLLGDPKLTASLFSLSAVPLEQADADRLVAATHLALKANRNADTLDNHGAALYRAGRSDEALRVLHGSIQAHDQDGFPSTWLYLAMTQRQRGNHNEASRFLARFEAWHKTQTFDDWQRRVIYQTLLAEARRAIGPDTAKDAPRKDK